MFGQRFAAVVAAAAVAALMSVALFGGATTASASPAVPFSDPAVHGRIGLCGAAGNQITSGSINTHPFVTRAVSSVAAPNQFKAEAGGKATVFAFQPRRGTEAADWSGRQVTAASFYSNSAHPMAAGTELDYSLADFLSIFPAHWDGLVQLRMFLSAPNQPAQLYPYAATTIKVTGSRWRVLDGGSAACGSGQAKSSELANLSPAQFRAQLETVRKQRAALCAAQRRAGSGAGSGSAAANRASGGAAHPGAVSHAANAANAANAAETTQTRDTSGVSAVVWVVLALAMFVLAGLGAAAWQRRGRRVSA